MADFPAAYYEGQVTDEDNAEAIDTMAQADPQGPAPPADGYTWRKYGQKFIKKISMNRSYFRCQRSNCEAKKQVEWKTSDSLVKVVYTGNHNHPPPSSADANGAGSGEEPPATMGQYNLVYQVFGDSLPRG
ncbi:putative WRKY transcription factor 34 [Nymphaea thermarum]|nr:putative WRKY transcription factor 34 [Nymphaea thermarum]